MNAPRLGNIVHATPGRIRLRVARAHRTPEEYAQVEGLLRVLPGIQSIEITPGTGSVLVRYDATAIDVGSLLQLGAAVGADVGPGIQTIGGRPSAGGGGRGFAWPAVDRARLAKGAVLLGVAGLGGVVGPAVGVGARFGSILASIAFIAAERSIGRVSRRGT